MELQLPPELETMLREQAAARGMNAGELAIETIRETLSTDEVTEDMSNEEWKRRLRSWASSHPSQQHHVDASRESIYRGRGE